MVVKCFIAAMALAVIVPHHCKAAEVVVDVHVHFNWDQKEVISADEVVSRLREQGVSRAIASGTPSMLALELYRAGPDIIVPIFSPYIHELGRRDWHLDPEVVRLARIGLEKGLYRGIGEIHFMSGFRPRTDNDVFQQLVALARDYDVPALIHVDAGNETKFVEICSRWPRVRILYAHAGGKLHPVHLRKVIEQCPNVLVEFSARDPWRYGGLTGPDGSLLEGWRKLVLAFPDRFAIGTDPVWRVTRTQSWDEADDGWDYFQQILDYHLTWINQLPVGVQNKIRHDNARAFLELN